MEASVPFAANDISEPWIVWNIENAGKSIQAISDGDIQCLSKNTVAIQRVGDHLHQ